MNLLDYPTEWINWQDAPDGFARPIKITECYIMDEKTGELVDYRLYFEPVAQA